MAANGRQIGGRFNAANVLCVPRMSEHTLTECIEKFQKCNFIF